MAAMRVLVVDDEAPLLMTLAANLELEGFDVIGAANANDALTELRAGKFDLVLSDIRMPGMNGVDLFRQIKQIAPDLPVVLMTGFAVEELVQDAMREGAYAVLPKPCPMDQVLDVVGRAARAPAVLVVDDVAACAESTAAALSAVGIKARAVTDAQAALDQVRSGEVDVCVVDMVMPEVSGPDLMEQVRSIDRAIAFIAVTGELATQLLRRAAALGAHTCMSKPISPEDLARAIARARGGRASK
ncbi:MAG: response regulator [Polyangiales bacterium]